MDSMADFVLLAQLEGLFLPSFQGAGSRHARFLHLRFRAAPRGSDPGCAALGNSPTQLAAWQGLKRGSNPAAHHAVSIGLFTVGKPEEST